MELDWRLLGAPELLQLISEKLPSIADYIRFRAVCPAWRCAASPRPRLLAPQLPWLILPRGPNAGGSAANLVSFLCVYDLSQSKTHTLHLPQIRGKRICGCSHGWLALQGEKGEVFLLNPITRDQISLPSLSAPPKFFEGLGGDTKNDLRDCPSLEFYITKAILSSNPSLDPDCLVIAQFLSSWNIAFCKVGGDCWTVLAVKEEDEEASPPRRLVSNIVYHNHLLYAICADGEARKWDLRKPSYKVINSGDEDIKDEFVYVRPVEGTSAEHGLMMLCKDHSDNTRVEAMYMSLILMLSEEQATWSNAEEKHTSRYCFFFGGHFHCISLPLANLQLHGWDDGNCICYTYPEFEKRVDDVDLYSCSIKLYKLDDRSVTTLVSHLGLFRFRKILHFCGTPCFLWLTPTLC